MTNLIEFADAVTASNLNPTQKYAVYYADGLYANETTVRARCPHAKLYGITVTGLTGAHIFACDSETGDLTAAQAEEWVAKQIELEVKLVCVYADLDRWENQGLKTVLAKYGARIKRWVADYDDKDVVPAGYDAKQYEGGITDAVDRDVALESFFSPYEAPKPNPVPKPAPPARPSGVVHFQGTVDLGTGKWSIKRTPGTAKYVGPDKRFAAELSVQTGEKNGGKLTIKGIPTK